MQGKISKQTVDRLAPGSLVWDQSLVGFGVRRQLKHPAYIVRYRIDGKQKFLTIGRHGEWTPETARRECQRLLGLVATGIDPAPTKLKGDNSAEGDSFADVAERFLARQRLRLKPRSIEELERYLRKSALPLHSLLLAQIGRKEIASALGEVERSSGPVARNRFRSNLSAMFAWAITEGLIEHNPVTGTAKADENGGRERVLREPEIKALWRACADNSDFSRIVRLLLLTGQRRNEIGLLRWSEIDLANATLTFAPARTKNRREHTLPLPRQALALLPSVRSDVVFASTNWASEKVKLNERLRIAHWTLHDLRRTCATGMAELGVLPHIIEAILNHVSGHKAGVAGIYNRSKLIEPMRDALQKWADHIEVGIAGPREQPVPTGLMERAFAVARGGKIVPNEDLANLSRQLKNKLN